MAYSIKNISGALLFVLFVSSVNSEATPNPRFIPSNYKLEIITKEANFKPDAKVEELVFDGKVTIDFASSEKIKGKFNIILNADKNTTIRKFTLNGGIEDTTLVLTSKTQYSIVNDKLVCKVNDKATGDELKQEYKNFQLVVEYSNPFGNDMTGFYRSSYKEDGKDRVLLTTHFEPIFARKAFPCFDEPDLKAFFEIEIKVPSTINTVLSNTPPVNSNPPDVDGFKTYSFKKTNIPMSTYLVAFTASNLTPTKPAEFVSDYNKGRTTQTDTKKKLVTYGRKDFIKTKKEGELGQIIGKAALENLTSYLEMGYALDKVDQVGIPDFSAGAMENFGHVSFREKALFFSESLGTAATKQSNVLTITHELVHQWFGNLVTLKSWDYIWLNEAFANYLEYIIADNFTETKDWKLLDQMVVNEIHLRAFETDGLASSKPLNNKITDESLIFSAFNDIPYSKGAAVLRMWNLQLKDDGFRKTLVNYLKTNKETAVDPEALYNAFNSTAPMDKKNFDFWTNQTGYPVVEVKKINGTYTLSQTRFFWENKNESVYWEVPITYSADNFLNFTTLPMKWLSKNNIVLNHTCKWIIVNNKQAGYYRVNYDTQNWNALAAALKSAEHSKIPELNRAQIVNDVFSLARSLQKEYVAYSTALDLAKYLSAEKSFIPWKTAVNAFEFLRTKMDKDDMKHFQKYIIPLIKPHFKSLNSTGLKHVEKLMNVEISRLACALDHEPCIKEAKEIFNKTSYNKLPDTQEIILCTVVRNDKAAWNIVSEKYKTEEDSSLKIMYMSALGCTSNQTQVEKFLNDTLGDNCFIRNQDLTFALSAMYNGNLNNVEVVFKFIEKNFKTIATKYGGINPLGRAFVGIARKLKTSNQYDRLKKLAEAIKNDTSLSAAKESVENGLNIAESNVKWVEGRMKHVKKYLNSGSFLTYSIALLSLSVFTVFQF